MVEKSKLNIILLSSISLLVHTGFGIAFPIYPKILENFGKGATELGLLIATFGFTYVIFSPLFGSWADRHGKKKIIVIGLIGFAISNLLYIIAIFFAVFELLFVARALEGAFASAVFPSSIAMVADFVPEKQIAKNIGIVTAGNGIGMLIGPIVGGYLFAISIVFPFYISAGLAFLTIFWTIYTLKDTSTNLTRTKFTILSVDNKKTSMLRDTIRELPNPKFIFIIFILVDMSFLISWMFVEPGVSFYFYNELTLTPTDFGLFIALYSFFASIGGGLLGGLSDKFGRRPIIIIGLVINATFYLLMMSATILIEILLASILGGLSLGFIGPAMKALLLNASPKEHRTTIFGIASGLTFIGSIFGPIIGGYMFDVYSIDIVFRLAISVSLFAAVLGVFLVFQPINDIDNFEEPMHQ